MQTFGKSFYPSFQSDVWNFGAPLSYYPTHRDGEEPVGANERLIAGNCVADWILRSSDLHALVSERRRGAAWTMEAGESTGLGDVVCFSTVASFQNGFCSRSGRRAPRLAGHRASSRARRARAALRCQAGAPTSMQGGRAPTSGIATSSPGRARGTRSRSRTAALSLLLGTREALLVLVEPLHDLRDTRVGHVHF